MSRLNFYLKIERIVAELRCTFGKSDGISMVERAAHCVKQGFDSENEVMVAELAPLILEIERAERRTVLSLFVKLEHAWVIYEKHELKRQ